MASPRLSFTANINSRFCTCYMYYILYFYNKARENIEKRYLQYCTASKKTPQRVTTDLHSSKPCCSRVSCTPKSLFEYNELSMGKKILPEISIIPSLSIHSQNIELFFFWLSLLSKSPRKSKKYKNTEQTLKGMFWSYSSTPKCIKLSDTCT